MPVMSCDRARELMFDALVEPLGEDEQRELDQHIASCDACAAEAEENEALWKNLETIAIPPPSPDGLERLQSAVKEEFGQSAPATNRSWYRAAAAIALVALGGILSFGLQNFLDDQPPAVDVEDDRARFLLIMTETTEGPELAQQANEEIGQWFADLAEQGILEPGSGVAVGPAVGVPPDGPLLQGPISGIVVIRAADIQEARRITITSPIITYGGFIEIRSVD